MPMQFKKGDSVRQIVKPIEGEVKSVAIVDDEVQFEVGFAGADGEQHSRFFKEDEIEAAREKQELTASDVGDVSKVLGG